MGVEVIEQALTMLCDKYIFPDKATAAAAAIQARRDAGEYDGLTEQQLAERLTAELFDVCADKHLRVRVRETELQQAIDKEAFWREHSRLRNYGIAKIERLDGNIGYIDLRLIADAASGGQAMTAAMTLVAHTHALIIDLRNNVGGVPEGVIFWNSFLFPDDQTHLNSIYDGTTGETRQYWSLAYLPGPRYLGRPVFVLISDRTFSGGEEFCYNLKAQARATLIGETTRGGAHPTEVYPLTPTIEITIPHARSINPVTGTNWEGVGVEPDIKVPAEEAFDLAYHTALQHALTTATSSDLLVEIRSALAAASPES